MENVRERIKYIKDNKSKLSDKDIVDELLKLDAENVDLGKDFTKTQKDRSKTNSRIIVKEIKNYDADTYFLLSKGFDL